MQKRKRTEEQDLKQERNKRKPTHPQPLMNRHHKKLKEAETKKPPKERKVRKKVLTFPPLPPLVVQPLFPALVPSVLTQIIMDYYFPVNWILVSAADDLVNDTEEMRWFLIPEDEPLLQDLKDKEDQVTDEMLPWTMEEVAQSRWRPFKIRFPLRLPSDIIIQKIRHFTFQY